MRAALEQDRLDARARRAASSAERTRAASFSPVATITSTPAAASASVAVRLAAREQTRVTGDLARRCARAASRAAGCASESNTTRARLARARPRRARSAAGRRRSRCRCPTATASHSARQRCARARLASPEIHLESPVRGGHLAVERHRRLEDHERAARCGACLRKGWLSSRARVGDVAVGDARPRCPRRAGCPGRGRTPSRDGSSEATTTRAMPGLDDRVRAGRGAARGGSTAPATRTSWRRRGSSSQAASATRSACGSPARRVEALAEHAPSAHHDRADQRVGRRMPAGGSASSMARRRWPRSRSVAVVGAIAGTAVDSRVNSTRAPPGRPGALTCSAFPATRGCRCSRPAGAPRRQARSGTGTRSACPAAARSIWVA